MNFHKALRLLDCGKTERAVEILQEVIQDATQEGDELALLRAHCVLGEVYFEGHDFDQAKAHLETALNVMDCCGLEEDLFDYEKSSASALLHELDKPTTGIN